jgi:hypothetical protein
MPLLPEIPRNVRIHLIIVVVFLVANTAADAHHRSTCVCDHESYQEDE